MEWIIKTIEYRTVAFHKHNDTWVESYRDGEKILCCECDEAHQNPVVLLLTNCDPRPNCKAYLEYNSYFKKKGLKIRPLPSSNPEEWNDYGHNHETQGVWKPVIMQEKVVCPSCLELAPREYLDLSIIPDISKGFKANIKVKDSEKEVMVQLI